MAWLVLLAAGMAVLTVMLAVSAEWQRQTAVLVGLDRTTTSGWLRAGPLTVGVAGLLIAMGRGLRLLTRLVARLLRRWVRLPRRLASVVGAVAVTALIVAIVDDVLVKRSLSAVDEAFRAANLEDPDDVRRPISSLRSGSPASLVSWESLGLQGRRFVSGGPTRKELQAVFPGAVNGPIRVYGGLNSADDPQEQVDLALAELRRTGPSIARSCWWSRRPAGDG